MAKKKSPNDKLSPAELAGIHVSSLAAGKAGYKTADFALEELLKKADVGQVFTIPSDFEDKDLRGKKFCVKDKFAGKNSIPVGQSVRRYELEEVPS